MGGYLDACSIDMGNFLLQNKRRDKKIWGNGRIAKNLDDPSDVEDLLENFKENKANRL